MKKNQVNSILINQAKRRNIVLIFSIVIITISLITILLIISHIQKDKIKYIEYNQSSNVDYKVLLKESEYFEEGFLEKDNVYISSLIKNIEAKFNYNMTLEESEVEYKYNYRVEANVLVKEKDNSEPLFTKKDILVEEKEKETSSKKITITENVDIDYNKYNDLIKRFITLYNLDNTESILTIDMYINIVGSCESFEENANSKSVLSLEIPLTLKTTKIELSDNLVNNENNIMKCEVSNPLEIIYLILALLLGIVDIALTIYIVRYIIKNRTAEDIYEKELKKILNNYSSYIQELTVDIDLSIYQILSVKTFTDMLEIRDTINQPILMKEEVEKRGAYFIIPADNKIMYMYRLKVSDIERTIIEK